MIVMLHEQKCRIVAAFMTSGGGGGGARGGGQRANALPLFFKKGHMSTLKHLSKGHLSISLYDGGGEGGGGEQMQFLGRWQMSGGAYVLHMSPAPIHPIFSIQ